MMSSHTRKAAAVTMLPMLLGLPMSPPAWCADNPIVLRGTLHGSNAAGRLPAPAKLRGSITDDRRKRGKRPAQPWHPAESRAADLSQPEVKRSSDTMRGVVEVPTPVSPLTTGALAKPPTREGSSTVVGGQLGLGYTTNAGPTLAKVPSMVVSSSLEVAHGRRDGERELSLDAAVVHREFSSASELSTYDYKLKASWAGRVRGDERLSVEVGSEKRADVDEVLARSGGYLEYEWTRPVVSPFARVSAYYLDYSNGFSGFLVGGDQDDRDRVSAVALAGVKYHASKELSAKIGVGTDVKLYSREPELAWARNSHSLFPFAGLAYDAKNSKAEVVYAPVFRRYEAQQLDPLVAHTVTARGEFRPGARLRLIGSLRLGLEEADFLTAKAINEFVISVGGVITTSGGASLGLEVAYTLKDYVGVSRLDRKFEAVLQGRAPLGDGFFVTAEAKYLNFHSSFVGAETDMAMGTIGIAYQITR
jgi:hypothetical protein